MDFLISKIQQFDNFYQWSLSISDHRVGKWPLMAGYSSTWILTFLYIILIVFGKRVMKSFAPFEFRWTLFVYNGGLVALNGHICFELFTGAWRLNYSYWCQPVNYSYDPQEMRIARALWWYYISKLIEFMDTFFFVLRKKNNQISFLHIYHHASMFPIWWIGVKWVAGGSAFFGPMINAFIHVVMYTYYMISALGPQYHKYLWWKKYLTKLQLTQFVVGMIFGLQLILTNCRSFPIWMQYTGLVYGVTMITLFLNFYYKEYVVRANQRSRTRVTNKISTVSASCNIIPYTRKKAIEEFNEIIQQLQNLN